MQFGILNGCDVVAQRFETASISTSFIEMINMEKNKQLDKGLYDLLNNAWNQIFLSVVSIWEIVIKKSKGKLKIARDLEEGVKLSGFDVLPIEISHALALEKLPVFHKDPFDRMLIA